MEMIEKNRDSSWDNIKGVLILLVVFAHCLYGLQNKSINAFIVEYIYFFHMPAFVFVSGYFSKSEKSRSKNSIVKLLVAYMIFMIPFIIRAMLRGNSVWIITPYFSAWYLLALIIWRLLTPHIINIKHILLKTTLFAIIIGFFPSVSGVSELAIKKVVVFWPFFVAGNLLTKDTYNKYFLNIRAVKKIFMGSVTLAAGSAVMLLSKYKLGASLSHTLPNPYEHIGWEEPAIRACIFIVSLLMILSIMYFALDKKIPFLTKIGRNTLPIFVMHRLITFFYYENNYIISLQARYQILGALILTIVILAVFGSDVFAGLFNGIVNNFTNVLVGNSDAVVNPKLYKGIITAFVILLLTVPVAKSFIDSYQPAEAERTHSYDKNYGKVLPAAFYVER